jgi:hypothetical protein
MFLVLVSHEPNYKKATIRDKEEVSYRQGGDKGDFGGYFVIGFSPVGDNLRPRSTKTVVKVDRKLRSDFLRVVIGKR